MKIVFRGLMLGGLMVGALAAPAVAQSGFALKAGYIYNRAKASGTNQSSAANGFTLGAEYVLPLGLGVGLSAYTGGRVREFDVETSNINVVAEANYFLKLPIIPITPYAGVHAGMGRYSRADEASPGLRPEDNLLQLGYQAGLRFNLLPGFGIDTQYRRVSSSLASTQMPQLTRNQVVIGVALF
jgi:hypothetical protein